MAARSDETTKARAELAITRILDAPRELVFAAWTDPARLAQWFGPDGFTATVHEMDVRRGGTYRFCMHAPDGDDHWVRGSYREIVAPERLVFTYNTQYADGTFDPETLVTVTLDDLGGGRTRLTLRHERFWSEPAGISHTGGWTGALERLLRHVSAG